MSIYATFFALDGDDCEPGKCARWVVAEDAPGEMAYRAYGENGEQWRYDEGAPCTCDALGAPYEYLGSHLSLQGPDHPRDGSVYLCRAVGTHTLRLGVDERAVLLDARQARAMRDALTEFLRFHDDPAWYSREKAWDASAGPVEVAP